MTISPIKTFIIYARADAAFKDELLTHLHLFVQNGLIEKWVDSDLLPGEEWEKRIEQELEAAHLVIMLVSADALRSEFIRKKELKMALEKKNTGSARVIPVLVRDCMWDLNADIAKLQMLPKGDNGQISGVAAWLSRDAAWTCVCRELHKLIQEIRSHLEKEAVERARAAEVEAQKQRQAAEKAERALRLRDESFWKKISEEAASSNDPQHKIELYESYLNETAFSLHRTEAEEAIEAIHAEIEAAKRLEAARKAAEQKRKAAEEERKKREEEARLKREEEERRKREEEERRKREAIEKLTKDMVFVKGGTFTMGCTSEQRDCDDDESPTFEATVSDFYLGRYEVTFEEYDAFCAATGREKPDDHGWGRGKRPVINVCWYDAVEYCNWLSEQQGLTPYYAIDKSRKDPNNDNSDDDLKWLVTPKVGANGYRLPTEAEWEYAARGGAQSKGYKYAGSDNLDEVAWYWKNSGGKTHPVGEKKPNELGLHDMSGNVHEWCWDWKGAYTSASKTNPRGPEKGSNRVDRGGSWLSNPQYCRVAPRSSGTPTIRYGDVGFRLARS